MKRQRQRTSSGESQAIRRLFQEYIRPYWFSLIVAILSTLLISSLNGAIPFLVKWSIDTIFGQRDVAMLAILPLVGIALFLFKGLFRYAQAYLLRYVGHGMIKNIRDQLFDHCLHLPAAYYNQASTGVLMSSVTNDIGLMGEGANLVKDLTINVASALTMIGVLFYLDWRLSLVTLLTLPCIYFPLSKMAGRFRAQSHLAQEQVATLFTQLQEAITGIRLIKTSGTEAFEAEQFAERNLGYFKTVMKGVRLSEMISPIMEVVGGLGIAVVIWYWGYRILMKQIGTPGDLLAFLTALQMFYTHARGIAIANPIFQQTKVVAERVFRVLDTASERTWRCGTYALTDIREGIEFRGVYFHYEAHEVLAGVNLTVRVGDSVAIVGTSGVGKTTLMNLLPRLYDPTQGAILIDGRDIREMTLASLRRQIGIVAQDIVLFNGTVLENITYGTRDVSMDRAIKAARAAHAHHFIEQLPQGYETVIGERGLKLSRGECQRLTIARALLRDPKILILDEATSSLDSESEALVQQALEILMKGRTTFIVAHRLSTIQNATTIVVLEGGRIVEAGTHHELLSRQGAYDRLYSLPAREAPAGEGNGP